MRVSKFLWFLMSWSMALSVPLLVAPSKVSAQTFPDCPSWAGVSGWTGGYSLTAKGKGALGAGTVNVSYSSSAVIHLTSGPQSCVTLTPTLGWSSTLDESNAIGSTSYESVYPCSGGGELKTTYSASGIGSGSFATLTVDFSKGLVTFVPVAVSATFNGTITACDGNSIALPYNTVDLTPQSSTLPSFPIPAKAQQIQAPENYTFDAVDINSGLSLTWTLNFQLTPDCDVPDSETSTWDGWSAATRGNWEQTLVSGKGTSFAGLSVKEVDAGGGEDTCFFLGSAYTKVDTLRGGNLWLVNSDNTWGPDSVGWGVPLVLYYRLHGRDPCGFTVHQQMHLVCYDGSEKSYGPVNTLKGIIGGNLVRSERAGHEATRRF